LLREYECAQALAPRALELCENHHFPNEAAFARLVLGTTQAQLGGAAEGIALMRQGINELLEVGKRVTVPEHMMKLGDAQRRAGALLDALETIEQALEFDPALRWHRPENLRVRGEIRLQLGQSNMAAADFRASIRIAREMQAKAWELRSTMSLARLLASQDKRDEARTMLAEIYTWFTEGFDTADLKDAKALLEELGA
jgi:predicted ATPase